MSELAEYLARNLDHLAAAPKGARRVVSAIGRLAGAYPDAAGQTAEAVTDLEQALARVQGIRERHGTDDRVLIVELMLLGKLGRYAQAIEQARAAYSATPSWASATALANALRRSGDYRSAADLFWAAARLDPADVAALLEVGDILLAAGAWAGALEAYAVALEREPQHPWAEPSAYYCRFRMTGDGHWRSLLAAIAEQPPDTCGVAGALQQIVGGYTQDDGKARAAYLLAMEQGPP